MDPYKEVPRPLIERANAQAKKEFVKHLVEVLDALLADCDMTWDEAYGENPGAEGTRRLLLEDPDRVSVISLVDLFNRLSVFPYIVAQPREPGASFM